MPELTPDNPTPERPERARDQSRVSLALRKISERALTASQDEISQYQPRELDLQICEAMLTGCMSFREIGEAIDVSAATVSKQMKDPLVCAWVSRHLNNQVATRLGLIDVSMLNRAINGNVAAAKLLFERYGKLINRNINVNVSGVDFNKMTDDDLDLFLNDAKNQGELGGAK